MDALGLESATWTKPHGDQWVPAAECLTGQQAGSGRDPVAVGFADHEIREYGVGSSPGGGDIRRPMLAQAPLKRPQQRLARRCIVGCLDAISDVAFGERACRRQYGF